MLSLARSCGMELIRASQQRERFKLPEYPSNAKSTARLRERRPIQFQLVANRFLSDLLRFKGFCDWIIRIKEDMLPAYLMPQFLPPSFVQVLFVGRHGGTRATGFAFTETMVNHPMIPRLQLHAHEECPTFAMTS